MVRAAIRDVLQMIDDSYYGYAAETIGYVEKSSVPVTVAE